MGEPGLLGPNSGVDSGAAYTLTPTTDPERVVPSKVKHRRPPWFLRCVIYLVGLGNFIFAPACYGLAKVSGTGLIVWPMVFVQGMTGGMVQMFITKKLESHVMQTEPTTAEVAGFNTLRSAYTYKMFGTPIFATCTRQYQTWFGIFLTQFIPYVDPTLDAGNAANANPVDGANAAFEHSWSKALEDPRYDNITMRSLLDPYHLLIVYQGLAQKDCLISLSRHPPFGAIGTLTCGVKKLCDAVGLRVPRKWKQMENGEVETFRDFMTSMSLDEALYLAFWVAIVSQISVHTLSTFLSEIFWLIGLEDLSSLCLIVAVESASLAVIGVALRVGSDTLGPILTLTKDILKILYHGLYEAVPSTWLAISMYTLNLKFFKVDGVLDGFKFVSTMILTFMSIFTSLMSLFIEAGIGGNACVECMCTCRSTFKQLYLENVSYDVCSGSSCNRLGNLLRRLMHAQFAVFCCFVIALGPCLCGSLLFVAVCYSVRIIGDVCCWFAIGDANFSLTSVSCDPYWTGN